jgi:hypothetical protein
MSTYQAFIQMPVILHERKVSIVETKIELPTWYRPIAGEWIYHPITSGMMLLGSPVFDGTRDTLVLTSVGAAYDFTVTLAEWLRDRPAWKEAEHPFISAEQVPITPQEDSPNDDFD